MSKGAWTWCVDNLFNSPVNTALTIVLLPASVWCIGSLFYWALTVAHWAVVGDNIRIFLIGTYPVSALWRIWISTFVFALLIGLLCAAFFTLRSRTVVFYFISVACIGGLCWLFTRTPIALWATGALMLLLGNWFMSLRLPSIRRFLGLIWIIGIGAIWALLMPPGLSQWGGLMLSVIITLVGTILSFPLGVLLAFGRRSRLPVVRGVSIGYIELIRSLPLISVLYWAWIIVPLLLPPGLRVADLIRGITGFVLFYAAYVAEYVRGGLQSVPYGQTEAANSLGLKSYQIHYHIVLPQALKAVLPGLVGNTLDIFNNVPLVFVIGLTDFLRAGQTILSNPQNIGREYVVYGFMFGVYLLIGGLMTYTSRRLEKQWGLGER